MGGVFPLLQPLSHGLTAVVQPHDARVIVRARMLRRIERSAVAVEEQGKVVDEQGKLPVCLAVGQPYDSLCAKLQRAAGGRVEEFGTRGLYDERPEQAMLLVGVCEQVVVEKHGVQFFVGIKPLDQGLILPCSRQIVPAVGCAVGHDGVEFYQMNMIPHDVRKGAHLECAFFDERRQQVGQANLDAVSRIGPDHQGLRPDMPAFDLVQIDFRRSISFDLLFQYEKAALGVMPAIAVVANAGLHGGDLKYPDILRRIAGAGPGIQRARRGPRNKICLFKWRGINEIVSPSVENAKGRLQGALPELAVDEVGVSGMLFIHRGGSGRSPKGWSFSMGVPSG